MDLESVKQNFPADANEIDRLESLGFSHRNRDWLDRLDLDLAGLACWLMGKVGDDRDADLLVEILASDRPELSMQAATSLGAIGSDRHIPALVAILAERHDLDRRYSVVYALSFLPHCPTTDEIIRVLTDIVADKTELAKIRAQALEGLGNKFDRAAATDVNLRASNEILSALADPDPEVRFWACFAAGAIELNEALPQLQVLARTDETIVPGWWSVGEEAVDAMTKLAGGIPPLRHPSEN
jgi:HEAT repeat protein